MWEWRLRKITLRYLRGWFILDVGSVLPLIFDFIALYQSSDKTCVGGGSTTSPFKMLRMIRILRITKLTRLLKMTRLAARMERRNTMPYAYISFATVMGGVLVLPTRRGHLHRWVLGWCPHRCGSRSRSGRAGV